MMQWLTDLELGLIQTLPTLQVCLQMQFLYLISLFYRTTESELTSNSFTSGLVLFGYAGGPWRQGPGYYPLRP